MAILHPDKIAFKELVDSGGPLLVDFFATWCGPCKMISSVLEKIEEKYGSEITVIKVDIDLYPELAQEYDVTTVPTLFFIRNKEILSKQVGFIPFEKISANLDLQLYGKSDVIVSSDTQFDLVIIGAGCAGLTAALYASRAGLKVAVLESLSPGGNMIKTYEIVNWPGIPRTDGVSLAVSMYEHAMSFGAQYIYAKAVSIINDSRKTVICEDGRRFEADTVIIASGTVPRTLDIPGEKEMIGRGVSFCAVCDGAFYKDRDIAVIGGGNSALEESLQLTRYAKKINIIIRRDTFTAQEAFQKRIENNEKINVIREHIPKEIISENGKLKGLLIENVKTGKTQMLEVAGIFPYIGDNPISGFTKGLNITDDKGYIIVNHRMETSQSGIYAAGDVCHKVLKQLITAANDGAIAAQHAFNHIRGGTYKI